MQSRTCHLFKQNILVAIAITLSVSSFSLFARNEADLKRDKTSKPEAILAFSGVKAGDHVLDFLGGGGYYSELLSEVVGQDGTVVLHNNQAYIPYVGKELDERLAGNRLKNVTKLMSEINDFKLGKVQFDLAFFVLGYHDLYVTDKDWNMPVDKVIPQIAQSLKPHARLLIIDHSALEGTGSQSAQTMHRIERAFVEADLARFGFKLVKSSDVLANPDDSQTISVFDPAIRRKTDRFVLLFEKLEAK